MIGFLREYRVTGKCHHNRKVPVSYRAVAISLSLGGFSILLTGNALAQSTPTSPRPGRTMSLRSRAQLAFGKSVQEELQLDGRQKQDISEINRLRRDVSTELYQAARHKKISMRELFSRLAKLNTDSDSKLQELLDEKQRVRLEQLFVQINDSNALTDQRVLKELGLTEDQRESVFEAKKKNTRILRRMAKEFSQLPKDDQKIQFAELQAKNRDRLFEVLTDEQRAKFETLKGEEIDFDPSEFRVRRSRTNRTRNVLNESSTAK